MAAGGWFCLEAIQSFGVAWLCGTTFPGDMHPFSEQLKAQGRALYHCEIYLLRVLPVILEEVKLTPNM